MLSIKVDDTKLNVQIKPVDVKETCFECVTMLHAAADYLANLMSISHEDALLHLFEIANATTDSFKNSTRIVFVAPDKKKEE